MRKGQIKILKKIADVNDDRIKEILSREDLTLNQLDIIYYYYREQVELHNLDKDIIDDEILKMINWHCITWEYLPMDCKDVMINTNNKNKIRKYNEYNLLPEFRDIYVESLHNNIEYKYIRQIYRSFKCYIQNTTDKLNYYNFCCFEYFNKYKYPNYKIYIDVFCYILENYSNLKWLSILNYLHSLIHFTLKNRLDDEFDINTFFRKNLIVDYDYLREHRIMPTFYTLLYNHFSNKSDFTKVNSWIFEKYILSKESELKAEKYYNMASSDNIDLLLPNTKCNYLNLYFDEYDNKIIIKKNDFSGIMIKGKKNIYENKKYIGYDEKYKNIGIHKIIIFEDGTIYKELNSPKKIVPISFREFYNLKNLNDEWNMIVTDILKYASMRTPIFKDMARDFEVANFFPIKFNDLYNYHTKNDLFKDNYVLAKELPINYNKLNANLSYMILKSYIYVNDKSKNILINFKDKDDEVLQMAQNLYTDYTFGRTSYKNKVISFLTAYIVKNIQKNELSSKLKNKINSDLEIVNNVLDNERTDIYGNYNNLHTSIRDYVRMTINNKSRKNKPKIDLTIKSNSKLITKHNEISYLSHEKETHAVKIPKNSKFNKLREILPDDFEWIKSRKRLILETTLQHHCVWSYADDITEDMCAIYSYVDKDGSKSNCNNGKPKRYTIEFRYDDNNDKYYITQIQGKYDRVNSSDMTSYLSNILNNYYNKINVA